MVQTRPWRLRSFASRALVWSQSRHRGARMRLPGDPDRRSIPSEDTAYGIAQGIRIPIHAAQDRLLPPGAGIASRLGAHPTSLALLISEQAFQEQAGTRRNALLSEQRTYPLLDLPKRRRPQRKRLLNRRCPRPRSSNHGCPWIQKPVKKANVMLGASHCLANFETF